MSDGDGHTDAIGAMLPAGRAPSKIVARPTNAQLRDASGVLWHAAR
jgi:hypothetical protein